MFIKENPYEKRSNNFFNNFTDGTSFVRLFSKT